MKQRMLMLAAAWALLLAFMTLAKPLFMLVEPAFTGADFASLGSVILHGVPMDLSMSAYLLAPVALLLIVSVWTKRKWMESTLKIYFTFIGFVLAASFVTDAILYPYWNFRLDATPLFYFFTSPSAALASIEWYWEVLAALAVIALAWGIRYAMSLTLRIWRRINNCKHRVAATTALVCLTAALIIPIRGGVTVSTMAPGRVFFSTDMRLNHAALNPTFTLMYSLMHSANPEKDFQYFDAAEADRMAARIAGNDATACRDSIALAVEKPDIYLIILESFSAHLMASLGGENIAVNLDSLAQNGLLFSNFYAESFRTDRALATILGGYPALPTASPLKFANKFGNMPSLSAQLASRGYDTEYYYGCDINFTNLNAFLVSTGFKKIISDTDFPVSERLSKWGVHDHVLFSKVIGETAAHPTSRPTLRVIQTSSSHEPFDVPYHRYANKRANAFAYADNCLGDFMRHLSKSPQWDRTLVVIVPDHWGAYPQGLTDPAARHHVPLVMTGGALTGIPARIDTPASQSGIAPTLLSLLGYDRSMFPFSRDMLAADRAGQFAWFCEPEWMCLLLDGQQSPTQVMAGRQTSAAATPSDKNSTDAVRAFTQSIYNDFSRR